MKRPVIIQAVLCLACTAQEPPAAHPVPKPPVPAGFAGRLFQHERVQPRREVWPLYAPGHLPAGTVVNESEALHLAEGVYDGQTTYLTGNFVVTAAGGSRAVLRFAAAKPRVRVLVEYPQGRALPSENATLKLDQQSGLLITEVRRTSDNPLVIYVRDITQPAVKEK